MIRRISKVTGMLVGTLLGVAAGVYGAGSVVSACMRCLIP